MTDYKMKKSLNFLMIYILILTGSSYSQNHAPGFYPQTEMGTAINDTLKFTLTAYDLDSDPLTWSAANLPAGATFNAATQEFLWIPVLSDISTHTITITVDDGQGNSVSKNVSIEVVNRGEWFTVFKSDFGVHATDIFFANDTLGWIVGEYGNILHTPDGGINWSIQLSGTGANLRGIFFTDENTGWIVGEEGVIYHTNDRGANWSTQNSNTNALLYEVFFIDANTGWAGGEGAIIRTLDGGANWETLTDRHASSMYFIDSDTGWVGSGGGGLCKTTNGGIDWIDLNSGTSYNLETMYFINSDTGWAAGKHGMIIHTTDGGATWNTQTSDIYGEFGGIYFTDYNNGWVVGDTGLVLYTNNGGTTWTKQNTGTFQSLYSVHFVNSDTGWATGPSDIIIYTIDGGINWNLQMSGSTDNGIMDVFFTDEKNGWFVGDYNTFFHSTDGGITWTSLNAHSEDNIVDVFFVDANNGWVVEEDTVLLRTVDGGNTWTAPGAQSIDYLFRLHFIDPNNGWLVGSDGLIIHTNDGGVNWTQQNSGWTDDLNDVYFANSTTGWVVGGGEYGEPVILHTSDGGVTWESQLSTSPNNLIGIDFEDSFTGWVVGENGIIFRTDDAGASWVQQPSGTNNTLYTVRFLGDGNVWAAGENGTILFTNDGGISWNMMNSGTTDGLIGLHFIDKNMGWASGESGIILKYRSPKLEFSFPETIIGQGDTVEIPMGIVGVTSTAYFLSFEFNLGFDTSLVEITGFETAGLLAEGYSIESNFTDDDTLKIVGMRMDPLLDSGTFMKLKVTAKEDAAALDTTYIEMNNIILNEGFPPAFPAPGKIITAGPLYGDVSGDGDHSSLDASLILQYRVDLITLSDTALKAAEVTGNGEVTAYDAANILRYVAGLISGFPAGYMFAPKEADNNSIAFLEKESENELFVEYILNLKNVRDIYAVEIAIEFSGMEYKTCEKTEITKDFLLVENAKDGILKIALAGFRPINNDSKIIKLKFGKLLGDGDIKLNSVVVNETSINVINDLSKLLPDNYEMHQNYPNPFNSETIIQYQLPEAGNVEISIYNILGQRIRTLVNSSGSAGFYEIKWNGTNDAGETVSSGIYFITLKAGSFIKTRKMIYMR